MRITDQTKVANATLKFQNYFMSIVGTKSNSNNEQCEYECADLSKSNQFEFSDVSEERIKMIMSSIDIGKATGLDNISPFIWNQLRNEGAKPLEILFNSIIDKCIYPQALNKSVDHPIRLEDYQHQITDQSKIH